MATFLKPYKLEVISELLAIGALAYWFHVEQKDTVERGVRNQLLSIADIKAGLKNR